MPSSIKIINEMKCKTIILFCFFILAVIIGCKKEAGPGGKNTISGSVVYKNGVTGTNDAAPLATVYIAYGTNESTSTFDQTILADVNGKFSFEGLQKGKYFLKAGYTDTHGFAYTTAGHGIIFMNKKKDLEVNMTLE
jgi:hypothetical protein